MRLVEEQEEQEEQEALGLRRARASFRTSLVAVAAVRPRGLATLALLQKWVEAVSLLMQPARPQPLPQI